MSEFPKAIPYVIGNEVGRAPNGGYVNHPKDPGGETKYGICKRDHPDVDIKNLTLEQAEEIYRTQYWCYDQIVSQAVATKLLDMAANMEGTGRAGAAIRIVQQAVNVQYPNVLHVDGKYGPNTTLMINRCDAPGLLMDMVRFALVHYGSIVKHNPDLVEFLAGWQNRAHKLPEEASGAAA